MRFSKYRSVLTIRSNFCIYKESHMAQCGEKYSLTLNMFWTLKMMRSEWRKSSAEKFTFSKLVVFTSINPTFSSSFVLVSWDGHYLAAFTFSTEPLCWILINSFSSSTAKNLTPQALNQRPREKVEELQIFKGPSSMPLFPLGVKQFIFFIGRFLLFPFLVNDKKFTLSVFLSPCF